MPASSTPGSNCWRSLDLDGVEPLPVLHLGVRDRELRIGLVDEEEPAACACRRGRTRGGAAGCAERTRASAPPSARPRGSSSGSGRSRPTCPSTPRPKRAGLEQEDVHAVARERPRGRRADDPAADDDRRWRRSSAPTRSRTGHEVARGRASGPSSRRETAASDRVADGARRGCRRRGRSGRCRLPSRSRRRASAT